MYTEYYCTLPSGAWGDPTYVGIRNSCIGKDRKGLCNTMGHPERLNCPWIEARVKTLPKPAVAIEKPKTTRKTERPKRRKS